MTSGSQASDANESNRGDSPPNPIDGQPPERRGAAGEAANPSDVTQLLESVHAGESGASTRLLSVIYDELKGLARGRIAQEYGARSLMATDLVHECYLRLFRSDRDEPWENRAHFFGAAAEAMRRILVDRARSRKRIKRGGEHQRIPLEDQRVAELSPPSLGPDAPDDEDFLALDAAIAELESQDERMARVVKLRYFAGLTVAEVAKALELTERTVHRDWAAARAWLHRRLDAES